MIRVQRRRHFRIWLILGPALLMALVLGLLARRPVPTMPDPSVASPPDSTSESEVSIKTDDEIEVAS